MRKRSSIIMILLLCLSLWGCRKSPQPQDVTDAGNTTDTTVHTDFTGTTGASDATEPTDTVGSADTTKPAEITTPTTGNSADSNSGGSQDSNSSEASTQATQQTEHVCAFGKWVVKLKATCQKEGREERSCSKCGEKESRAIAKAAHNFGNYNMCKTCFFVDFDSSAKLVELGIPTYQHYSVGAVANYVWDVKVWNGRVYRGAGDYDKNSGAAPIFAFDIATQKWHSYGTVPDQAVHRFEEIGGTLWTPGIDPSGSWDMGNYYMLKDGKWETKRNLPQGIHNFDMAEHDGKIFAGLGIKKTGNIVVMSDDGGETFRGIPLYKDGAPVDFTQYKASRVYEFLIYNGDIYALAYFQGGFGGMYSVFRYEDGKMVYVGPAGGLSAGVGTNRNHWNGAFEFDGACYLTSYYLYAITDFANQESFEKLEMPNKERVSDALLRDGVIYVLCFKEDSKTKEYNTVIYKSTTGKKGSFEEVTSFTYPTYPCSFDTDGTYFYIGTAAAINDTAKNGMMLRVKP